MPAKLKFFVIVILSIFATAAAAVVYIAQRQTSVAISEANESQPQHLSVASNSEEILANPERVNYKTIPLEKINSVLQGSDPATLALNAFEEISTQKVTRKVEVVYPQPNQALVTITQPSQVKPLSGAIKYRVELASFGRSLLATSPPVWEIVWAGSQEQFLPGSRPNKTQPKSVFQ